MEVVGGGVEDENWRSELTPNFHLFFIFFFVGVGENWRSQFSPTPKLFLNQKDDIINSMKNEHKATASISTIIIGIIIIGVLVVGGF